jgi:hypothetical protein
MKINWRVEQRMKRRKAWASAFAVLFALAFVGCASTSNSGGALLPEGIESAEIPQVDSKGYLYFNPGYPIVVSGGLFNLGLSDDASLSETISMERATLILGSTTANLGASLEFSSVGDSQSVWNMVKDTLDAEEFWGRNQDDLILLATGDQGWRDAVTSAYADDDLISVREQSPSGWNLLSNLPKEPPSKPVMAGVLQIDADMLQSLMSSENLEVERIGNAFGLVRVDSLAFAVYTDDPLNMSTEFSYERILNSSSGILFVSQSSYPSPIVSFMLGVMSDRTDLELIELATTNARYRTVDDLHLIIKNRGSLLYVSIATSKDDAEALMISALFD